MAEAVMGPLLGALQELVMKEAQAMAAVDDDVRNLRDKLMWLQAFLRDAEPRRRARNDELTRVCLHQIRGAVFDAEDAVDRYFLKIDLSKYPGWSQAVVQFFIGLTTQVRVRRDLSRRVGSINKRLERIIENKDKYKIDNQDSSSVTTWRPSTDISAAIENLGRFTLPLVGRDEKQEEMRKVLNEESKHPMVITLAGESGLGKTKLTKAIYEDPVTKEHFRVRVWVSFAPGLSASQILKLVLLRLALKPTKSSYDGDDDPGVRLQAALRAKIYLLVLDGEVSSTEWNGILSILGRTSSAKSRVVRITRTDPVAQSSNFVDRNILLTHLDKGTSVELFRKALLWGRGGEKYNRISADDLEMKKHLDSIHDVTGGLPLSVVLLAGLLQTKEFPGEWTRVFEHLTDKSGKSKRDDIILSMCFDDLPHDLKSCFLYLACFPVNMLVKARTMVCMWMAEGFLSPRGGMTMEKVGSHFLNELAQRHLINIPPVEYADPGFESVTVQSRVHDFLLHEAQEVHGGDDVPMLTTTRRLALQNHSDKYAALATPLPKLRSIFSSFEKEDTGMGTATAAAHAAGDRNKKGTNTTIARVFPHLLRSPGSAYTDPKTIIQRLLCNSKFLRVISLDGLDIGIELPHEIGSVVHLQHLAITSCSLKVIPPSIGKLTRLQTLDVRGTGVNALPMGFWKIRTLRHVFGSILLPRRVGNLEQLRNLTTVNHGNNGAWDEKTFSRMVRLNMLHVDGISASNVEAIYKLKYLVILNLASGDQAVIPSDLFTRSNLPRLQMMRLAGKMEQSPTLSGRNFTLPTLTQLFLKNTMVPQSFINQLGIGLPLLSVLVLLEGACESESIVFSTGFHSIKYVTLDVELLRVEIQSPAFGHNLVQVEIVTYSPEILVDISQKPDIKDKIKIDDKYIRGMADPAPEVPNGALQALLNHLMAATGGARPIASRIQTKP
ncbi:hypothetical protein CFC21_104664 [Triticum aestivum]|uniref:Uncharacterized protein n=3 Tax=Triticum TaxID=4564 RepID=A0A9R1C484_TRITD|nr:putative disease resistance RPP13-like protein 3 [Triticum dicoccoides]XP_044436846.1 putative disease resistance RPP13-like protein 3 [Triticum aestivum]KAF7103701.1 hypothetical protein CFC21_104664 [Triticum aestivum]VAI91698.1 unnamed protein product [Triticum turgidum subsp. durum]